MWSSESFIFPSLRPSGHLLPCSAPQPLEVLSAEVLRRWAAPDRVCANSLCIPWAWAHPTVSEIFTEKGRTNS